jgi:2-phosphoglycerate kinase
MHADLLSGRLRHVYWVGGASGAGKSTIARRLAARYGLRLYSTDEAMADHAHRYRPEDCPYLTAFKTMSMDERWVNRAPQTMLETFHWFRGEGFELIVEDLLQVSPDQSVLVEGFRLLPELVKPLLQNSSRAVWLIPTPEFRRTAFESRGALWSIAGKTSNPERALRNLLERDRLFSVQLQHTVVRAGLPVINVDGSLTEDALEALVAGQFRLRSTPANGR